MQDGKIRVGVIGVHPERGWAMTAGALAPSMVSWHADAAASLPPQATRRRGGRKGALEFLSAYAKFRSDTRG
jgi:hypothetical protein